MEEDKRYRDRRREANQKKEKKDRPILPNMSEDEIIEIVQYRVTKRREKQREFYIHLGAFVASNTFLWMLWLIIGGGFPWPLIILGGWGIGLFAHFIEFTQSFSSVQSRRDRLIQQEVEREKARLGIYSEKPKRDGYPEKAKNRPVRVGSDGEIVPLDELLNADDETEAEARYQRNQR